MKKINVSVQSSSLNPDCTMLNVEGFLDPKLIITHAGKLVSAGKEISNNTIAAAITALFLYKQGIEDRRRLLLTFHRTPTNQWRASGVLDMPNRVILRNRRPS